MVPVEDLMALGYSRRKVHEIANSQGYSQADEYPDELLTYCQDLLNKDSSDSAEDEFTFHNAASDQYEEAGCEDLQYVEEAAENRAAGLLVALDSLTMMHCATRQFKNPDLQAKVNQSRHRVKQVLGGVAAFYEPSNFLSQTSQRIQTAQGTGRNGLKSSTKSLNGSSDDTEAIAVEVT